MIQRGVIDRRERGADEEVSGPFGCALRCSLRTSVLTPFWIWLWQRHLAGRQEVLVAFSLYFPCMGLEGPRTFAGELSSLSSTTKETLLEGHVQLDQDLEELITNQRLTNLLLRNVRSSLKGDGSGSRKYWQNRGML